MAASFRAPTLRRSAHLIVLAFVLTPFSRAAADDKLDLQQFHSPATSSGYIGLDAPMVLSHLHGGAGLILSDAHDALALRDTSGQVVAGGHVVEHQIWLEALGSLGLFGRVELGLALPVVLTQAGDIAPPPPGYDVAGGLREERGAGLGDLRLDGKILLLDHDFGAADLAGAPPAASANHFRMALVIGLNMPTSTTAISGGSNVSGRPRLAFEWAYRRLRLALNIGAVFREREQLLGRAVTSQLTWGTAVRVVLWRGLEALVEGRGTLGVVHSQNGAVSTAEAVAELDVGLAYGTRRGLRIFAAGGPGLGRGYGTPAYRAFVGVRFMMPQR